MTLTYDPTTAALQNGYVIKINAWWLEGKCEGGKYQTFVPGIILFKG